MSAQKMPNAAPLVERPPPPPAPPSRSEEAALLSVIARAASDPQCDLDKMERLLNMQERIVSKRGETAFNDAMSKAQAEMRRVAADSNNPQTRSQYASYGAIDRVLRPIYTEHGFSISFDTGESPREDFVRMLAIVAHKDGFSRTYHADIPADGKGAKGGDVMTKTHAFGAATTYGMRYLLKMVFNVAIGEDDTDGNTEQEPSDFLMRHAGYVREFIFTVAAIKGALMDDPPKWSVAAESWCELDNDCKRGLWLAPSRGGVFTTREREQLKSAEFLAACKEFGNAEAST